MAVVVSAIFYCSCQTLHTDEPDLPGPQIVFLFSPGGLGDLSYNDCILEGVQRFKLSHSDIDVFMSSPQSYEEAQRIFTDWLKRPGSDIPVVFVLASSDYESFLDDYISDYPLADNKRILLFESLKDYKDSKISTFQISMYGASYLAGVTARECSDDNKRLVVLGSSTDIPVFSAKDGFIAGLGEECDVEFMADDWSGYVAASSAYQKMIDWGKKYEFIFPVAGGTNAGIYRYSREYELCPYLAGIDVDQSALSPKITGSVVKRFDLLIDSYFSRWLETGFMPAHMIYGLDSGFVDWILASGYAHRFEKVVEENREAAVAYEKEYYEDSM